MKILLITPLSIYSNMRWLPLGPAYISSLLRENGHEVRLYDRFLKGHSFGDKDLLNRDMASQIKDFAPDMIGFSTMSPVIYDTAECIGNIRNFFNGIVIAGGHHATALPAVCLEKIEGLDYVAAGEAEYTMLSLAEGKSPCEIPGLFSRDDSNNGSTLSHIRDLDELPFPDYGIFDMDYYTSACNSTIKSFYLKSACILTSRGCPNNCKFCSESLSFSRKVRSHSPDYVIENIERLVKDYGVEGIYFHDNNFLCSPSHAEGICSMLIKKGLNKKIKWEMQTGTPTVNDEILKLLAEAGCVKIEFGIESIREKDLKRMNKNADNEINKRALRLCNKYGIKTHTNFMTGFEGEDLSDLSNTLEWIKTYRPHTFSFHTIQVYPGTELYRTSGGRFFENNDWTEENIKKYFSTTRFDNMNTEEKRKWFLKIYMPFSTRHDRKSILEVNSLKNIIKMAYKRFFSARRD